jgi:hypothetical protein
MKWVVFQVFIVSPSFEEVLTQLTIPPRAGANNSASSLPEYCPPTPLCGGARLSGGNCPPQGWYEPTLCDAGFYCPLGGKEKIPCMYFPELVLSLELMVRLNLPPDFLLNSQTSKHRCSGSWIFPFYFYDANTSLPRSPRLLLHPWLN